MKKTLLMIIVLLTVGCQVTPEETKQTTNKELEVQIIGRVDGCTIYRFIDGESHYFVRCGTSTVSLYRHMVGKITKTDEVETITQ